MSQLVEGYLANDGVVQNDEYVQLLTAALADGVQDYELTAASQLLAQAQGIQQQAAAIYQQEAQQLAYLQAMAPTASAYFDTRNMLPGLINMAIGGIGIAQHREQVRTAEGRVRQATTQYQATQQRVVAYQTIQNELTSRASMWTKFMSWVNG
ncbi:MAG: hypothetical protein ACAI38_14090 [Myxococcota bacterium]